jgi:hypothetical protein
MPRVGRPWLSILLGVVAAVDIPIVPKLPNFVLFAKTIPPVLYASLIYPRLLLDFYPDLTPDFGVFELLRPKLAF